MALEIFKAELAHKQIVSKIVELYIYDLNEIAPDSIVFELDENGKFGYPRFDRFWQDPNCAAYLFKYNGKFAGFSLTHNSPFFNKDKPSSKVIGEFGILKMYRNKGIGLQAAKAVMLDNPGFWEMRVIDENSRAVYFWGKVLSELTNKNYKVHEKNDHEWVGKVFAGEVGTDMPK